MTILNIHSILTKEDLLASFQEVSRGHKPLKEKRETLTDLLEDNLPHHPLLAQYLTTKTLTTKGIEFILQKKSIKQPYAKAIKVCECQEDFFQECQDLEKKASFTVPFMLHNQTRLAPHVHFTSLYIQKNEKGTFIVISDSLGSSYYPNVHISTELRKIFSHVTQYILVPKRQWDWNSCRIFSMKDSLCFASHPDIFSLLQNPLCLEPSSPSLQDNFVKIPPPPLMTGTQSKEIKEAYLADACPIYPHEQLHLWEAKWEKHLTILNAEGKITNGRSFHFLCKYRQQILEAYSNNELPS